MKMPYTTPEMRLANLETADVLIPSVQRNRLVGLGGNTIRIEI